MEAIPATPDNSSSGNPNSVKSDDNSPQHGSGRGSPPPNCAICLGTCRNKSFTDSCLHQFCFKCLLTWSKVKAECPLCKQNFKSIIHNVRSNHQYEEYMVEQRQSIDVSERIDALRDAPRRFRYRTTLTLPRRESLAIQQLLLQYPMMAEAMVPPAHTAPPPAPPPAARRRSPASFRRTVYRHNLWARPLPDFTGRFRDCSPEFYRYNYIQTQRLVPWISRELSYLLNENVGHISYVINRILEVLPQYHINTTEFRDAMRPYFGERTEHFLHELYCFASTPYDMPGYDRHVQYTTDTRISTMVNEVISSSESDASIDSDIVMVSSSHPTDLSAGPSRVPEPVYPISYIPPPVPAPAPPPADTVIPIETISHSDTDDDDVMLVGYIKPPQERTPEVVDLLGSDSDVIVQDNVQSESTLAPESQDTHTTQQAAQALVKLRLKRLMTPPVDTDSEGSAYTPPPQPPRHNKRRRRSVSSAFRSDTPHDETYLPTPPSPHSSSTSSWRGSEASYYTTADPFSNTDTVSDTSTTTSSSSSSASSSSWRSGDRRKRTKTTRRKIYIKLKPAVVKEKRCRSKKSSTSSNNKCVKKSRTRDKRSKCVSRTDNAGKLKRNAESRCPNQNPETSSIDQPSTSGTSSRHRPVDGKRRRSSREGTRLRSVVNVMNKNTSDSNSNSNSNLLNIVSRAILNPRSAYNSDSGSIPGEERTSSNVASEILKKAESCFSLELPSGAPRCAASDQGSDSDDDRPLNLTIQKSRNKMTDNQNNFENEYAHLP